MHSIIKWVKYNPQFNRKPWNRCDINHAIIDFLKFIKEKKNNIF